jgi:hypothetical protein
MVIGKFADCAPAGLLESATWNVSDALVTAALGVPLTMPVTAFKDKPEGRLPLVMDHEKGAVPPLHARVAE